MSRAFVSENTIGAAADALPDLPQSPHPNYVTPQGHRLLEQRLAAAQMRQREASGGAGDPAGQLALATVNREIRFLEARLERAIVIDPAQAPADEVAFGAIVEVVDPAGEHRIFGIVGEDEADVEHGKVSWVSPLARALLGAHIGDTVQWRRPAGEVTLEVAGIRYPERGG